MSGGNCPETPRQKMIGMMYLFLTAMLAVNVSSTVLDGFTLVDRSLQTNNEIFYRKNTASYSNFKTEYNKNQVKFGPAYRTSLLLKEKADSLYNSLDSVKWELARKTDGEEGDPNHLLSKDNVDIATAVMLFKLNPKKPSKAEILKKEVDNYLAFLIDKVVVDENKFPELADAFNKSLNTKDVDRPDNSHGEGHLTWEQSIFDNIPIGAIMPLITKIQTDVRNTESLALAHLYSQVTASEFKVNDIQAHIIPTSTYLVRGSKFDAHLLLAAIDSTKKPKYEVFIENTPIEVNEDGEFEVSCSKTGIFNVRGSIITEDDDGNPNPLNFNPIKYEVVEPFATVSATKMNVMYAGVENPISISVPGFSSRDIQVSISDGSPLTPKGDGFIVKPKTTGIEINVIVSADINDKTTQIGSYPFRIKSLPPPTAYVQYPKEAKNASGKTITIKDKFSTGRLRKADLLKAYGIIADLEDTDFKVSYKVLGFDMTFYDTMGNAKTYSSTSPNFTGEQMDRIKGLGKGKQFFISNVRAVGPDGIEKRLPPIDITLI